jgi:hypothetical protein
MDSMLEPVKADVSISVTPSWGCQIERIFVLGQIFNL